MKCAVACLAVASLSVACASNDTIDSNDVNPDAIWGEYAVSFDGDTEEISLSAQFRVGGDTGTTVRLVAPAKVEVDGAPLEEFDGDEATVNIAGTFYYKKLTGPQPEDSYTFAWTRAEDDVAENTVAMPGAVTVDVPAADFELVAGTDLAIAYTTDALDADEALQCSLGRRLRDSDISMFQAIASADPSVDERAAGTCVIPWSTLDPWFDEEAEFDADTYEWGVFVRRDATDTSVEGHPDHGGVKRGTRLSAVNRITVLP